MTWEIVFQVIMLIIGSLGGGSAIMLAVTKWGSELLAAKIKTDIEQKYKMEMATYEKQLSDSTAKLNALLQDSSYITQRQYDLEIEIYKNTWKALFELMVCKEWIEDLKELNPQASNISNENDLRNQRKKRYMIFSKNLGNYQKIIDSNAPFYQEKIYTTMKEIASGFQEIECIFFKYMDVIQLADQNDRLILEHSYLEIDKEKELLVEMVRNYLQALKCVP